MGSFQGVLPKDKATRGFTLNGQFLCDQEAFAKVSVPYIYIHIYI